MKFTYDFIKENIRIYNEAKEIFPIISQYERGEITYNAMRSLKMESFADFFNFKKAESKEFNLIQAISYKELRSIICDKTKNERFKTLFKNRSEKQFNLILTEDGEKFDRYLNGRWVSKPGYNNRGRKNWGKRSNERTEGLNLAFIPLINYIISNDIDTYSINTESCKSFQLQDLYQQKIKWYTGVLMDLSKIPTKEVEVTTNLLNSLVNFISESNIDFRKLNSDFIVETISQKVRKLMEIPIGTKIKSNIDLFDRWNNQVLTKNNLYEVESSSFSYGFLRVFIKNDSGLKDYYDYLNFEDLSIQRDILLSQLGII